MLDVTLLGTGGMLPLPQRALTSLYIRHEGHSLLVDCGEGTQTAIRKAELRIKPIDAIFITHFHADHISGLPGLLLSLGNEGRTEPITMYGPEGLTHIVRSLCVIAPELPFEISFCELMADTASHFSCAGLEVDAIPLSHRIPCMGYRFSLARAGRFDPVRAKEKGIPVEYWGRLQHGERVGGFSPGDVLGAPRRGLSILYATDTRPVKALEEYGKDADLLVLEGMFGDSEKQSRAEESRHMTMQEAAHIAKNACAHELWLTHYSPANPEPSEYADEISSIFPRTVIARDGMRKVLCFTE